jgi:hypothetical protein
MRKAIVQRQMLCLINQILLFGGVREALAEALIDGMNDLEPHSTSKTKLHSLQRRQEFESILRGVFVDVFSFWV